MNVNKITFVAAISCLLAIVACKKEVIPSVVVDDKTIEVSADGSSKQVTISSNVSLTAEVDVDWINASIEGDKVLFTVSENYSSSREGSISLKYNEKVEASIAVKQKSGSNEDIKEVEAFYYAAEYGEGTQEWMLTFYSRGYMDDIEGVSHNTYTFDLVASDEFTFTSGKFPVGTFTLNENTKVGAIYSAYSKVMDGFTYESDALSEASLIIEKTDVEDEYAFYVKCKADGGKHMRFYFKAVCGTKSSFNLRKYDTRVQSTITKNYDITFGTINADLYPGEESDDLELFLVKGNPAMGIPNGDNCFTSANLSLYTPKSEDISGTYNLDFDFTFAPYTIFFFQRYWWFSGCYPDPSDPTWLRPLDDGNLTPSAGSITLAKQEDGSYKIDGEFVDDYTEDYASGKHTVKFHGQFNINVAEL